MTIETLLSDALAERAAAVVPPPDAWEDNARRLRRARRRLVTYAATAAAVVAGGAVLAANAVAPPARRPARPDVIATAPATPGLSVTGAEVLAGPVPIGSLDGREVALYLARRADGPWACTAVAGADGRVAHDARHCEGPAGAPPGGSFVMELIPLRRSGLPVPDCAFGPLGNLHIVFTRVAEGVVLTTSAHEKVELTVVPGTEGWPVAVYRGEVPAKQRIAEVRVVLGDRPDLRAYNYPEKWPPDGCPG